MKILIIGYKLPFPGIDGGEYALKNFAAGLIETKNCEVHYITIGESLISLSDLPIELQQLKSFQVVKLNYRITYLGILKSLFSSQSYFISRYYQNRMRKEIIRKLNHENFDIIHLEHICLARYISDIRKNCSTKIIVRTQNIEYLRWESILNLTRNPIKYFYFNMQTKKLKRNEKYLYQLPDGIIALTQEDASEINRQLNNDHPVKVIPPGYNFPSNIRFNPIKNDEILRFYFIGSMDWIPNLQGVEWFLNELYPVINKNIKNVEFHFAGKRTPQKFLRLNLTNVFFHGEVNNANEFIRQYDFLFVPLKSGGGIKIKIMEALANGKPVLSHTSALGGFDQNQCFIFSFDGAEDLLNSITKIQLHQQPYSELNKKALNYAENHFNASVLGYDTFWFYESLLDNKD